MPSFRRTILSQRPARYLLLIGLIGSLIAAADWWHARPPGIVSHYVGRGTCAKCHRQEHERWSGSYHDLAMAVATPESVLGDFNDQQLTHLGITSRMFRKGDEYFIHTEGPDGQMRDYKIKYTFGVRPLQQYMVEMPGGRVQVLRISWDSEQNRWFYVPPPDVVDQRLEPDDPLHWTGLAQNWNTTCAECHSTDLQKNYDLRTNTYHTTFSEIDVSCEACHGPGSLHVELARSRSLFWDRRYGYGLVHLKSSNPQIEIETCAQCHSRRHQTFPGYRPGQPYLDYFEPSLLEETLYHADGQILDEVYVYGSFLQSRMHREGVRCTDCHDPHSTQVRFDGNALCAQCHIPGKYDGPSHHHHKPGTAGSYCVDCHMPATTYMVVDPRRDHSLRIPRPDLTVRLGTPNACNGCHTRSEEDAAWAAAKVVEWYGPNRLDDPHYGIALDAGRKQSPDAVSLLVELLKRRTTPDIVRATAIELLGGLDDEAAADAVRRSLQDPHPLTRAAAVRAVPLASPAEALDRLGGLLGDKSRLVRTSAAVRLASVPSGLMMSETRRALKDAIVQYETGQLASSERAACHLNLGNLYQQLGRLDDAQAAFRTAIRLEPYLTGPRSNLAALIEASDSEQAQKLRREEHELMARDVKLLPANALVQYRYGLSSYMLGRFDEARHALEEACRLDGNSYNYRLALTLLYEKLGQWNDARRSAETLGAVRPGDRVARDLLERIRRNVD